MKPFCRIYLSLLAISFLLAACVTVAQKSTHHAYVRVMLPGSSTPQEHDADFQHIQATLATWAAANDFKLADTSTKGNFLHYQSSGSGKNLKVVHYLSISAEDKKWPTDAMLVYDPDTGIPWIEIGLGEGYGTEPSEHLRNTFHSLSEALTKDFGDRVSGKIW